jgi:hypothetical protein
VGLLKIFGKKKVPPINVCAGDTITGTIVDDEGKVIARETFRIAASTSVDTMVAVTITEEAAKIGLEPGAVGIIFGKGKA